MSYNVSTIPVFDKQSKRLSKKYPSLKNDLSLFIAQLASDPLQGGIPLGNDFYKHRMMISSKGKGKSAGARIISYIKVIEGTVYLSAIYDKSEKENFLDEELTRLYKQITDI